MKCNLCGHNDGSILLDAAKANPAPHPVIYFRCKRCSFVTLNLNYADWLPGYVSASEQQNDDQMQMYVLQEQAETWSVIAQFFSLRKHFPIISEILEGAGKRIVDVGCGAGGSLLVYQALGWQTCGIEPGERQSEYARTKLELDVHSEFYSRQLLPAESLDMIHNFHTLEHIENPFRFLQNFSYHLRPGGLLYIETPNVVDTERSQLGFGHISLFSPVVLRQTLQTCGFEIITTLDRSAFTPHGIGILARKRIDLEISDEAVDADCIPTISEAWRKDPWFLQRIGLAYAFWVGRSGEVNWLSWPYRLLEIFLKKYIAPRLRALRRKRR
jgi:2-polyprenyl-3-methyl-5-hydroxy-6-metoxy-1,4-benzoquinol methylase